jgi:hypothetical protein
MYLRDILADSQGNLPFYKKARLGLTQHCS